MADPQPTQRAMGPGVKEREAPHCRASGEACGFERAAERREAKSFSCERERATLAWTEWNEVNPTLSAEGKQQARSEHLGAV